MTRALASLAITAALAGGGAAAATAIITATAAPVYTASYYHGTPTVKTHAASYYHGTPTLKRGSVVLTSYYHG